MDGGSRGRIGRNEALFREVNEAIERGLWPGEDEAPVRFRCECARFDCDMMVELRVREYERVREHPRRFFVLVGHEVPDVEEIVEMHGDYVVVEKRGQSGAVARELDPRD
jgi:hypothetical protein